jgi:hypothetical protein
MTSTSLLSLQLNPPNFTVDVEDDNIELWSFRLPVAFPLSALKGIEMSMTGVTKIPSSSTTTTVDGKEYRLERGDLEDTESFRVLVIPKDDEQGGKDNDGNDSDNSSSSSDDDDDEKKDSARTIPKMVPLKKSFAKHFSVLADIPPMTETQVAPREGPPPQDTMRHAYSSIPQRTGLKRRWMPLGVVRNPMEEETEPRLTTAVSTSVSTKTHPKTKPATSNSVASTSTHREALPADKATGDSPTKRFKTEEEVPSPDSDDASSEGVDEKLSKSERKAKKAEKKAAKKAKKEAKKAKKAAKKVKKES